MPDPLAAHAHAPGDLAGTLAFLKRARWELRELWRVRVWADRLVVLDVNGDGFEVRGLGYPDADVAAVLRALAAAFDPQAVHDPPPEGYKEFACGRRWAWGEDRVM